MSKVGELIKEALMGAIQGKLNDMRDELNEYSDVGGINSDLNEGILTTRDRNAKLKHHRSMSEFHRTAKPKDDDPQLTDWYKNRHSLASDLHKAAMNAHSIGHPDRNLLSDLADKHSKELRELQDKSHIN